MTDKNDSMKTIDLFIQYVLSGDPRDFEEWKKEYMEESNG